VSSVKTGASPARGLAQRGAAASDPYVARATQEALALGNAVDAVVAGVLVAAARSPSVLLGPLQAIVGGAGTGLLAVDGRVRQPGTGAPRPRGFVASSAVPDAARVGVPGLPAAVAALVASLGAASLHRVVGPAIEEARGHSADRARVLQAFARRGAPALAEGEVADELTAAAGRPAQGLLTRDDLTAALPAFVRCDPEALSGGVVRVPWRSDAPVDGASCHVVVATDGKGQAAVACYEAPDAGVAVPALGLVLPLSAEPVRRGKTRVRPRELRPAAAPIALRLEGGIVDLCLGVGGAAEGERALEAVLAAIAGGGSLVEALRSASAGRTAALLRVGDGVRVLAGG
jgi:gamma-glutamyltranspeptidase/glutathione hydrolase